VALGWDASGNLTSKGAASFHYDYRNRLIRADAGGVLVDTAALAVPFVPGGAGVVLKACRAATIIDMAQAVDAPRRRRRALAAKPRKGERHEKIAMGYRDRYLTGRLIASRSTSSATPASFHATRSSALSLALKVCWRT